MDTIFLLLISGVLVISLFGLGVLFYLKRTRARMAEMFQQRFDSLLNSIDQLNFKMEERIRLSDELSQRLFQDNQSKFLDRLSQASLTQQKSFGEFKEIIQSALSGHQVKFHERQLESFKLLQDTLQKNVTELRKEVSDRVEKLTSSTDQRLKEISGQVEKRLSEGFEKTTATFTDIIKRLALIDEAQKKITELSTNVVSLQAVLSDKRSRGAFGEVQLASLIRNLLPEKSFAFQYTLSNDRRVDCMLFLPSPTGNVAIDAKFPLESYQRMIDMSLSKSDRQEAESQFRLSVRKHIQDIAEKYILPPETAEGAVMFIPAEAVFAEIHSHFPDLVELSQKLRVWMVSPTTMMAILTTARAVLKDEATRQQVHVIQEHLGYLAKDFGRFQDRMDDLAKHIEMANQDVSQVHISAKKITERFKKIDGIEIDSLESSKTKTLPEQDSSEN